MLQLTSSEDGTVLVPTYDWQTFLGEYCNKVPGIKKLHHLHFSSATPGCIFVKERLRSSEEKKIVKNRDWRPTKDDMSPVLTPSGLSLQRQWYQYDKMREFCPVTMKDATCPKPSQATSDAPTSPAEDAPPSTTPPSIPPPTNTTSTLPSDPSPTKRTTAGSYTSIHT